MLKILDVAIYVVKKSREINCPVSNIKLQKILYFIQAEFIVRKHELCFEEHFRCWRYGPVIAEVYRCFKCYGSLPIGDESIYDLVEINGKLVRTKFVFKASEEDRKIIDDIIERTSKMNEFMLIHISQNQDPWQKNYVPDHEQIIPYRDMFAYFETLQ